MASSSHSIGMIVFSLAMASLHLLTFIFSIVANFVASDCGVSITKLRADQKTRLFRRLTVLQFRIGLFHNLWRLPVIILLLFGDRAIVEKVS